MIEVVWVSAAALTMSVTAPATAPSFCQRMAAELPMKEKRVAGTLRAFDLQTLSAARRLLIGGTTYFSMKLEPVDDTVAERQRMESMCDTSPCTMEGPLRFTLGLKDGTKHIFEARPGERMRVEMVGTRVRCSDL
ncbi:hypothetical protein [Sphingomonas sp.]|uniref:hypothetical protein n=1 Tax=Sphingomonas sp. TaxID=28214 RepID=UPI00289AA426|nr:hypothetical protein [Sphingomonas sp.]